MRPGPHFLPNQDPFNLDICGEWLSETGSFNTYDQELHFIPNTQMPHYGPQLDSSRFDSKVKKRDEQWHHRRQMSSEAAMRRLEEQQRLEDMSRQRCERLKLEESYRIAKLPVFGPHREPTSTFLLRKFNEWWRKGRVPREVQAALEQINENSVETQEIPTEESPSIVLAVNKRERFTSAMRFGQEIRTRLDLRTRTLANEGAVRVLIPKIFEEYNVRKVDRRNLFNAVFEFSFTPSRLEIESQQIRNARLVVERQEANRESYYSRRLRTFWLGPRLRGERTRSS